MTRMTFNLAKRLVAVTAVLFCVAALPDFARAAGPGVSGRVFALDEEGLPSGVVPGAKIEFKNQGGGMAAQTTTDANGYYKVDLSPGTYSYKVQAEDFKDENVGRGITLTRNEGYAVYNFSLVKGKESPKPPVIPPVEIGRLHGRVLEKLADGKLVGIPDARIALRKTGGGARLIHVTSGGGNDPGHYEVVLPAGSYRASVSAAGFELLVDPNLITIVTGKDETRDFVLERKKQPEPSGQGITGTITAVDMRRNVAPLPTANITIRPVLSTQPIGAAFNPDSQGKYARDLLPGSYEVMVEATGYQTFRSGPTYVFAGKYTIVNATLRPIKPPLEKLAFVATVYELLPDGAARKLLPGATVLLRKQGQPINGSPRGTTGADGKVRLESVTAGDYEVLAYKTGYKSAGQPTSVSIGGANSAELILGKTAVLTASLTVEVMDRDPDRKPAPAAGARVAVLKGGQVIFRGITDTAGHFVAADLPRDNYQVEANKDQREGSAAVSLAQGDVVVRIFLGGIAPQEATLTVQVQERDRDGDVVPAGEAGVLVRRGDQAIAEGTTGAFGRFITRLPPGTYLINASKAGRRASAIADLTRGDAEVQLLLDGGPPPPALTVLVQERDPDGRAIPAAGTRILVRHDNQLVAEGLTDNRGRYMTRVQADSYAVMASKAVRSASAVADLTHGDAEIRLLLDGGQPPPTLAVQVLERDSSGRLMPVGGARVVVRIGDQVAADGSTGPRGNYVTRLRAAIYTVVAMREEQKGMTTADLTHGDQTVRVILGGGPEPKALLTVQVQARTTDGRLLLVSGAQVMVRGDRGIVAQGMTDTSGQFIARNLARDDYKVSASKGNQQGVAAADLSSGDQTVRVILGGTGPGPQLKASLTVQVQARDSAGRFMPVGGAQVMVRGDQGVVAQGMTDSSGQFIARNLARDDYKVSASKGGQQGVAAADLSSGDQTVRVILGGAGPGPQLKATLTVQVQARDPDGKFVLVSGAQVMVRGDRGIVAQGMTDAAGRFIARDLARDDYKVSASKGNQQGVAAADLSSGDQTVRVILGGTGPGPQLKASLTVQVQARDPGGRFIPVGGAQVMVRGDQGVAAQGMTDSSGQFIARNLARDDYKVSASKGSQQGAAIADLSRGDQTVRVVLGGGQPTPGPGPGPQLLKASLTVQVQAREPDGKMVDVRNAQVMIRDSGKLVAQGMTDASGRFIASALTRDTYQVSVNKGSIQGSAAADITRGDQTIRVVLR